MITVKFFGLLGLENDKSMLQIEESLISTQDVTIKQVFDEILKTCPKMNEKKLSQAILFLNKEQLTAKNRLSTRLKDGDLLTFLSPAGGG
jgi:molybdopterin converting factor small subunit